MSRKHFRGPEASGSIKYIVFGFSVIFRILEIAFLGIGLWMWNEKGVLADISSIIELGGFDPVWLFFVVGRVTFSLGLQGALELFCFTNYLPKVTGTVCKMSVCVYDKGSVVKITSHTVEKSVCNFPVALCIPRFCICRFIQPWIVWYSSTYLLKKDHM